jgi:hypothetical protein
MTALVVVASDSTYCAVCGGWEQTWFMSLLDDTTDWVPWGCLHCDPATWIAKPGEPKRPMVVAPLPFRVDQPRRAS